MPDTHGHPHAQVKPIQYIADLAVAHPPVISDGIGPAATASRSTTLLRIDRGARLGARSLALLRFDNSR